jgi:hypothetical protein
MLLTGLSSSCAAPANAQTTDAARTISSAEDVINFWTADQHVYVKGNLGVSADQLAKLERWFDTNFPHWTIVLMENAVDESYRALDNRQYFGMDAAEHALGHGLSNRTDFGSLTNSKTGETDGAIFVLFLTERKFSYYGSDIHDRRGLGESRWIGDLDREAIRAMRNGGRIIDAVKNSVNLIESQVEKKLAAEVRAAQQAEAAAKRAVLERQRELNNLILKLEDARQESLERIENSAREIRTSFPEAAESKLANPPVDEWKTQLDNLKTDLEKIKLDDKNPYKQTDGFRVLTMKTDTVRGEIEHWLDLYAAHKSFSDMLFPVENRLDQIADHPSGAAIPASDEAYRILADAKQLHARGELDFADQIQLASNLTVQAEQAVELAQAEIQKQADRRKLIRRTLGIVVSGLSAIVLGLLWYFNLRRRPALRRAHEEFDRKSKAVELELAEMQKTRRRSESILGDAESFAAKQFSGSTLKLGNETMAQLQLLNTLSSESSSVIATAHGLLQPPNPLAEAANMFSGARYEHCINLLNGNSLRLPAEAITVADTQSADGFWKKQAPEPIWLSFDQFFKVTHAQIAETNEKLDTLDFSLKNVNPQLRTLEQQIEDVTELEQNLSRDSRLDRHFSMPAFFESLLPAVQSDFDRAQRLANSDPVTVLQDHVPQASRKINDALLVGKSVQLARKELFPQLETAAKDLRSKEFDVRWMDLSVTTLNDRAQQLMLAATDRNITRDAESFADDVAGLKLRAQRCAQLAIDIAVNVAPGLERLKNEIATTRKQLAGKLNLDPSQALHESDYDPDVELDSALQQLQSARAALNYGGVESVLESLEVIEIESNNARNLLTDSLKSVSNFDENHRQRLKFHSELTDKIPALQSLVDDTQTRYAASAMAMQRINEINDRGQFVDYDLTPAGKKTIADDFARATQLVRAAAETCQTSHQLHFSGSVLEAANLIQLAHDDLHLAASIFHEIEQHCAQLDTLTKTNLSEFDERLAAINTIQPATLDPRTQRISLDRFAELQAATLKLQSELLDQATGRDPFSDHRRINDLTFAADVLNSQIIADRHAHAESSRAVDAAQVELQTANQSVFRSVSDRIPDSATIKQCQTQVSDLETELKVLQQRLSTPHDDWKVVSTETNRLMADLAGIDGLLRRELELARKAANELESAAAKAYEAASWSGPYGILIAMEPGGDDLRRARRALSEGEYNSTIHFSSAASHQASQALARAQAQVAKKKREIAHAAAAARRQRSRSTSMMSSGGSSFGGSSRSSSWSSSSHSSSSSRSSSSNSGFSRSGW